MEAAEQLDLRPKLAGRAQRALACALDGDGRPVGQAAAVHHPEAAPANDALGVEVVSRLHDVLLREEVVFEPSSSWRAFHLLPFLQNLFWPGFAGTVSCWLVAS
jgi:hypothetical protein